jgi:hypothetical protein
MLKIDSITSHLPVIRPLSRLFAQSPRKQLDILAGRSPCALSVDGGTSEAYCMRTLHLPPINQAC